MKRAIHIQYAGIPGDSKSCVNGVMRLLQFGDEISQARILTCSRKHCLLLQVNRDEVVAIKSGFTSGYGGEGPRSFSLVLRLLHERGVEIDEYEVGIDFLDRVDAGSITNEDLMQLEVSRPVRPMRLFDYVADGHWESQGRLWNAFPPAIPFSIIDHRIIDLALKFPRQPDTSLLTGYRRLEDIVRKRTGIDEHGHKLFSQAFLGEKAKLCWVDASPGEQRGRAELFTGAFMAYRNPRAHQELEEHAESHLIEFLLLNHLYVLESVAEDRDTNPQ